VGKKEYGVWCGAGASYVEVCAVQSRRSVSGFTASRRCERSPRRSPSVVVSAKRTVTDHDSDLLPLARPRPAWDHGFLQAPLRCRGGAPSTSAACPVQPHGRHTPPPPTAHEIDIHPAGLLDFTLLGSAAACRHYFHISFSVSLADRRVREWFNDQSAAARYKAVGRKVKAVKLKPRMAGGGQWSVVSWSVQWRMKRMSRTGHIFLATDPSSGFYVNRNLWLSQN